MDDEPREDETPQPADLGLEGFVQPPDEQGLSLEDLSAAYAQLIDGGADPYQNTAAGSGEGDPEPEEPEEEQAAADPGDVSPRGILEAMLFVGNPDGEPLNSKYVASLMRGVSPREIDELVQELNVAYDDEGRPYRIESSGPGYLLQLREEFAGLRDKFYGRVREARLSQAAIDVLALVAYRQPLTTEDVNNLRGTPSGTVLSQLVRRQLLRIERPEEKPRKPRFYTTERFLNLFGLAAIEELPQGQDFDVTS